MATSGIVNGSLIGFYVAGVKVANATAVSFEVNTDLRETTNHDSAGYETNLAGKNSWSASCEGWFAEDATSGGGYDDFFALWLAKAPFTAMISSGVSGDKKYTGSVLLTNLKRDGGTEDNVKFSVSVKGTGALTEATI
jgi:predicted secreted protein